MPVKQVRLIKPFSPSIRNTSPKIIISSDSSSDEIDNIDTPADHKILFDFTPEESSYEYDYEYSQKDWLPDPNEAQKKVEKHNAIPTDHSPKPLSPETTKRVRPIPNARKIQKKNIQPQSQKINHNSNQPTKEKNSDSYYDSQNDELEQSKKIEIIQPPKPPNNDQTPRTPHRYIKQNPQISASNDHQTSQKIQDHENTEIYNIELQQIANSQKENEQKNNQPDNQLNMTQNINHISQNPRDTQSNATIQVVQNQINSNQNTSPNYLPPSQDILQKEDDDEQTFQMCYASKTPHILWKREIMLTQNDVLVYTCKSIKNSYGKVHIITTKRNAETRPEFIAGMIVRHQTGSRFTLYEKFSDFGCSPQVAGISLITPKTQSDVRQFRVALPTDGEPYFAKTKMEDLSRFAYNNENVPANVKIYESILPTKKPDGSYTLNLGKYMIVRSTKNFCVKNENDQNIFIIFKKNGGACTIKFRPPFTKLISYAIAVAISTSIK